VSALDRVIEVELARPCGAGAPLLHRLVDGELSRRQERCARAHLRRCAPCRAHLRLIELEEQAIRELAAPGPRRFVALWADRLRRKTAAVLAQEAGAALAGGRPLAAKRGLGQLAQWLRDGPEPGDAPPREGQCAANAGSASRRSSRSRSRSPARSRTR